MADIEDVQDALVSTIAGIVYPSGTGSPSVSGQPTIVYPGWPQSSQLDADMAGFTNGKGGRIHITVFPTTTEKNTTRYFAGYDDGVLVAPTITLTVSGQEVTLSGTISTPQNVAMIVNGAPYTYAVQGADTLATVATALAAQISGASSAGAVITLPSTAIIDAARSGGYGAISRMTKTQQRTVQITVWADTPAHRTATASAIDSALSGMDWITFPDGSRGRLVYVSSRIDDMTQKANLYRRDLMYSVEYSTFQTVTSTEVVVTEDKTSQVRPDGSAVLISTIYQ